jgi:hypothetical protein
LLPADPATAPRRTGGIGDAMKGFKKGFILSFKISFLVCFLLSFNLEIFLSLNLAVLNDLF